MLFEVSIKSERRRVDKAGEDCLKLLDKRLEEETEDTSLAVFQGQEAISNMLQTEG